MPIDANDVLLIFYHCLSIVMDMLLHLRNYSMIFWLWTQFSVNEKSNLMLTLILFQHGERMHLKRLKLAIKYKQKRVSI